VLNDARQLLLAMGPADVAGVLNRFEDAATMAVEHGFRHVQFHAAHGYLLNLLIDDRLHKRAANVRDQLSNIAKRLSKQNVETSIRISLRTGEQALDQQGGTELQDAIAALSFDYVDLSSGFYNIDKRLIYPSRPDILSTRFEDSIALSSRHPDREFILSGRALSYDRATLPANVHLGICRDLIANPNVLDDQSNGCMNKGKCHYYSRRSHELKCGMWARH